MSELDLNADEDRKYVPTLAERIAEAIPTELTATPHVGAGAARRTSIAHAVLPVVEAELRRREAETRRKVAEEIRAKLDIDLRSTPWVEGYWFARNAAVAIARGGNEQTREET